MADRLDYYFRQKVTEAELDSGFDGLEQADRDLVVDQGFEGIVSGLGVAEDSPASLEVVVGNGVAYSKDGERIYIPTPQTVDLSEDDAAASTAVGTPGNEKWISLFVVFDRLLTDPRVDGNAATVFFDRSESFGFSVVQSAEAGSGLAVKPALDADKILLCDVLMTNGKTTIVNADVNTDRRESRTFPLGSAAYGGGATWADGTTNPATDVESQLDKIIDDLGQSNQGADRILSAAIGGSPTALVQGGINNQLGQLLSALNVHLNSVAAHAPDDVGAVALAAADTITAIKTLGAGGQISGAAARSLESALIEDLRVVTSDAALLFETNSENAGAKLRLYVGDTNVRGGFSFTLNCSWDPDTNEWVSDVAGVSYKINFPTFAISHHTPAGAGERWTDNSAGWDRFEGFRAQISATQTNFFLDKKGTLLLEGYPSGTPVAGRLTRLNVVKAWANVQSDGGGGTATLNDGYRIGSVSVPSSNILRVELDPVMSDTDYAVVVTENGGSPFMLWTVDAKATTHVDLQCFNTNTSALVNFDADTRAAGVMIMGRD